MQTTILNNYAFIDSQNLHLGIKELSWKLDNKKFRVYLRDKYQVQKAYLFIGYIPANQDMYTSLQEQGYVLIFKQVMRDGDGKPKGNVDADLVLQAMIDLNVYSKAVIVTGDGDFSSLTNYLYSKNKLETVISPNRDKCSVLLRKAAREKINFLNDLRGKLEYSEKAPRGI